MTLATAKPRNSASLVLTLLLFAYILNYLDRQILGILAGPIIADLHLRAALRHLHRLPGHRDVARAAARHLPHPQGARRVSLHGADLR